jgi:23S rRNA (cytosine1962-C5)-methyltransferase
MELWPHWRDEEVLFEDEALIAVDKPAHLASHRSDSADLADVRARVAAWLAERKRPGPLWLSLPLDSEASGVVVLAKTKAASRELAVQLERGVPRRHLAVVDGRVGAVAGFAVTRPRPRLVELASSAPSQPVRRALAAAGAPIAGDEGGPAAHRLMLHLAEVELVHPESGAPLRLEAPLPIAMERALAGVTELPGSKAALVARIAAAADRRYAVARGESDAFRLVNAGGDELPGVEVDRYGEHAVVSLRSDEAIARRELILDAVAALGFAGVYLKLRGKEGPSGEESAPPEPVRGTAAPVPLLVREAGLVLASRLGDGMSTGVFFDQRDARRWLRGRAAGRTLLNLFAYHGAFTVAAVAGGARASLSVDASGAALEVLRENLDRAGADPAAHRLARADAGGWLARAARRGDRFDLVVLDPPSFSTHRRGVFRAARDYVELAALALRCTAPGGALLACTNHRGIVRDRFRRDLREAATRAGATIRMTSLPDPSDYPPEPGEEPHLKRVVVEVLA